MKLPDNEFIKIIANTPLVSIDLIIREGLNKQILMGKRLNKPAQGKWFVPGGRIRKDEDLDQAFKRISISEIGIIKLRKDATFIGAFTHKYNDNYKSAKNISTHYIVLAYEISISSKDEIKIQKNNQHSEFKWIEEDKKRNNSDIHSNSSEYFKHLTTINDEQYKILNERRNSFNNLLWQTPIISLTAQAFLFSIILSDTTKNTERLIAVTLSVIIASASIQLFIKHRFMENMHAKILNKYEESNGLHPINHNLTKNHKIISKISSYKLWICTLASFIITAIISIFLL